MRYIIRAAALAATAAVSLGGLLGPAVAADAAVAPPAVAHPSARIFGGSNPDCEDPTVNIAKVHAHGPHPHVFIPWRGHLRCSDRPTNLSSFMTLQKWVPQDRKWELLKVTRTHDGVHFIAFDLWTRDIRGPSHGCTIAKLRANWVSHGDSSTVQPGEISVCSPVLKITSCGSNGEDVFLHGSHKRGCPNPLLQ